MKKRLLFSLCIAVLVFSSLVAPLACGTPPALSIYSITQKTNNDTSVTIAWSTDRDATSQVEYGTSTSYGTSTTKTTALVKAHSVTIIGLTAGAEYHYKVKSTDASAVSAESSDLAFNTTGLVVSGVESAPKSNSATITWTTDDDASSQVEYGTATTYGTSTTKTTTTTKAHSVTLTNLTPGATYHYKVLSDSGSDTDESADMTFTAAVALRLTAGMTSLHESSNPFLAQGRGDIAIMSRVYEPLVVQSDGEILPRIAKTWTYDESTLTWTMNLDPDATWSDGNPVTADDVKYSFDTQYAFDFSGGGDSKEFMKPAVADTANTVSLEFKDNGTAADTIERATGSFITDGWEVGESVKVTGTDDGSDADDPPVGDNDSSYLISGVTATVLTLHSTYTLVDEGPKTGVTLAASGPAIDAIVAVNDTTVTIEVNTYVSAFLDFLNSVYIVPKHIWESIDDIDAEANLAPVGSGPWLWEEYVPQAHVAFKRNPNYWGGTVQVDELVLKIYGSQELALLALETGAVDMVPTVELYSYIPRLLSKVEVKVGIDTGANFYNLLYVDHREEPNNLPAFRQAVSMAIDRQEIIDFALFTYGSIPRMTPFVPKALASENVDWPGLGKTDQERIDAANDMLDLITDMSKTPTAVGDPPAVPAFQRSYDGTDLIIEMKVVNRPADVQQAEIIQENMKAIGITINISPIGFGPMMGTMFGGNPESWSWSTVGHGAGGSTLDGLAQEFGADPYNTWYDAASLGWGEDGAGGGAPAARAVQEKLRQSRREPDAATLTALIETIQVDFAAELPLIPLTQGQLVYAYRFDKFTGWAPREEMDGLGSSGHLLNTTNILALEPI